MMTAMTRYAEWLDLAADLCRHHVGPFPRRELAERFQETFDCPVAWNWMEPDGSFGLEMTDAAPPPFPTPSEAEVCASALGSHPLVCWYARSGDPTPMTVGRVPRGMVPDEGYGVIHELLALRGWEQQLAIPYVLAPGRHRAFVLVQGRADFTDQEVDLARRLQPLLAVLERQARVFDRRTTAPDRQGLTARELAVLGLLRDGSTAVAIGHRLLVSPRTVHAHLHNVYRKLGVTDRMRAVLVAQELGLFPEATQQSSTRDRGATLAHQWASWRPTLVERSEPA